MKVLAETFAFAVFLVFCGALAMVATAKPRTPSEVVLVAASIADGGDACGCFPGSREPVCVEPCTRCMCRVLDDQTPVDEARKTCWRECR